MAEKLKVVLEFTQEFEDLQELEEHAQYIAAWIDEMEATIGVRVISTVTANGVTVSLRR